MAFLHQLLKIDFYCFQILDIRSNWIKNIIDLTASFNVDIRAWLTADLFGTKNSRSGIVEEL